MPSMPLAELVEDMDLYPRHAIDMAHVASLAMTLEAGTTLPPIVADKESKCITDGWHRARAYRRVHGPEAVVDVELIAYPDRSAMVFDAVHRNAEHGLKLQRIDQTRSALMLRMCGFNDGQIAGALHVPEARVEKLSIKVAHAPKSAGQNVPGSSVITLKRSVQHLEGKTLTKAQAQAHASLPGTSFLLIARQLCLGLTENMIDLDDEKLVVQLKELRDLLSAKLS